MNVNFDRYIETHSDNLKIIPSLNAILSDAKQALSQMPFWDKAAHIFWLLGPFILLIERTPADIWVTLLALGFVIRASIKRDFNWLRYFWVKSAFVFWFWCIFVSLISQYPTYSFVEAIIWFRFPLFAMATVFWLSTDKRLLYAMLVSIALGLIAMCGILTAELLIEGQKNDRLMWPYGDKVPGNYLAKVGHPAFVITAALAVSLKGRLAVYTGLFALVNVVISILTGERVNSLIRVCSGMLAGIVWKPNWKRVSTLFFINIFVMALVVSALPGTAKRYTSDFVTGVTELENSGHFKTINGGLQLAQENLLFGIGPANYGFISYSGALDKYPNVRPDVHPHNYYVQILLETGVPGLILGTIFLWSIIWICLRASFTNKNNVFVATAWVIPFSIFWPIATSADFFGQWNNIFIWTGVSIALSTTNFTKNFSKNF